jgi:hypothetical protein
VYWVIGDLLADLGQTKPSRRSIQQAYAEPLLQQRDTPADPRFWHSQRARRCQEPAIENDGRKELEIIEIAHDALSIRMRPTPEPTQSDLLSDY